jgi:hypothetical protein
MYLSPESLDIPVTKRCSVYTTWRYSVVMPRSRRWIKSQNFQGFGCSACNWKFNPSGVPMGASLDEMKRKYEAQRDKEFAAHVCVTRTNTIYQKTT